MTSGSLQAGFLRPMDGHEITEAENGLECLKKLKKALYPN
jgi:hypothetical protein